MGSPCTFCLPLPEASWSIVVQARERWAWAWGGLPPRFSLHPQKIGRVDNSWAERKNYDIFTFAAKVHACPPAIPLFDLLFSKCTYVCVCMVFCMYITWTCKCVINCCMFKSPLVNCPLSSEPTS